MCHNKTTNHTKKANKEVNANSAEYLHCAQ